MQISNKKNKIVSIIIPTKNSAIFLESCLKSIKNQEYKYVETIIVDGKSTDDTLKIAKKYKTTIYAYSPDVPMGTFDAPHKRNYGVNKANGDFVYYLDSDMELTRNVLNEAVKLCELRYDAIIIPEDSFGVGVWASAKNLERRCYWEDDTIEAPRFFRKKIWDEVGGLDENIGGGGDDWDIYQKLLEKGFKVGRTKNLIFHNEGDLRLSKLFIKRFMYGRDSVRYIVKRPKAGIKSYFPIRRAYFRNWKLFINRPIDTIAFLAMRTVEYFAGFLGIAYSILKK